MDHEALEKRKKTIYSLLCDDFYVPMKAKEMAMLLQIPKSQRAELQEVLDALVADGIYGNATANAVRTFQRLFGLTVDGIIGRITWNRIVTVYNSL